MRYPTILFSSMLAALIAEPAEAQLAPLAPTGNFLNVAFGLVWNTVEGPRPIHARGLDTPDQVSLMPAGTGSFPGYTLDAIATLLTDSGVQVQSPPIIDGISSWNDLLPIDYIPSAGHFRLLPPNLGSTPWGTIFVAVEGVPTSNDNPVLQMQYNALGNVGGEVIGYYFDTNQIPQFMVGETFLEVSHAMMGPIPTGLSAPPQLAAIDINMANVVMTAGQTGIPELPARKFIAFSLTKEYVNSLGPNPTINGRTLHGTSIIASQWDFTAGRWIAPADIIFDHTDAPQLNEEDDVDAVAVGTVPIETNSTLANGNPDAFDFIMFSVARTSVEQVLVSAMIGSSRVTAPLHTSDPMLPTITQRLRLGTGLNIRGICTQDPELATYGRLGGHPKKDTFNPPATFVVSATCRAPTPTSNYTTIHVAATGDWPEDQLAYFHFGIPNFQPLTSLPSNNFLPAGLWLAHEKRFDARITVPRNLQIDSTLVLTTGYDAMIRSDVIGIDTR